MKYNDKRHHRKDGYRFIIIYLRFVISVILFLLCSCNVTKYVPVETVRTEYKYGIDTIIQKDSCVVLDSIYIHERSDTVWYERWRTSYIDRWKERIVIDSFVKRDTITLPYPIKYKSTRLEEFCLNLGKVTTGIIICAILSSIVWLVSRVIRRFK